MRKRTFDIARTRRRRKEEPLELGLVVFNPEPYRILQFREELQSRGFQLVPERNGWRVTQAGFRSSIYNEHDVGQFVRENAHPRPGAQ